MTKDELIQRLKIELAAMVDWAREVDDEYLDGDPDTRAQYRKDMQEAREALSLSSDD